MDPHRLTVIPLLSDQSPEEAHRPAAFATEGSVADGQKLIRQGPHAGAL